MTAIQAQNIVSQRAEEILRRSEAGNGAEEGDDCEISCTPAFQESTLGGGVTKPVPQTEAIWRDSDCNELLLFEEQIRELPELEHVVAVKDEVLEASSGSNNEELCVGSGTGAVDVDSVSESGSKLTDDIIRKPASPDTQLAVAKHTTSFCDDFGDLDYPTLWQLTAEEIEGIENFYVPALISFVAPLKVDLLPLFTVIS